MLLAWGTDFIRFSAPDGSEHWSDEYAKQHQRGSHVKNPYQLRVNAYRVLLTRGRDAAVVFIPPDSRLERTAAWLQENGVKMLGANRLESRPAAADAVPRRAPTPPPPESAVDERATSYEQSEHDVLVEVVHEIVPYFPRRDQ